MIKIGSKKQLEVILSKLSGFHEAKVREEQYITPSNIAAEVLWKAFFIGNIENKKIADMGSGTGVLGIGCLLLGADSVFFVENDEKAMKICRKNLEALQSEGFIDKQKALFVEKDINEFNEAVDLVVMNPPFGTKKKHADLEFLKKAFDISKVSLSFHKTATANYITKFAEKNEAKVRERFDFKYILWNTMEHHMKSKKYIEVSCFMLEKK